MAAVAYRSHTVAWNLRWRWVSRWRGFAVWHDSWLQGTYFARATRVTLADSAMELVKVHTDVLHKMIRWSYHPCCDGLWFVRGQL